MSQEEKQIILASASPRRLALLAQIGISCRVIPADIDETVGDNESIEAYVLRLAKEKSATIFSKESSQPVLAADTSISFNGKILGKPTDEADAFATLAMLSGKPHKVITGISVRSQLGSFSVSCATIVRFRTLSSTQIEAYCDSGEPMGKAGSYAIQGLGGILVESIDGSYSNVVGLPLYETSILLEKSGIEVLAVNNINP